ALDELRSRLWRRHLVGLRSRGRSARLGPRSERPARVSEHLHLRVTARAALVARLLAALGARRRPGQRGGSAERALSSTGPEFHMLDEKSRTQILAQRAFL